MINLSFAILDCSSKLENAKQETSVRVSSSSIDFCIITSQYNISRVHHQCLFLSEEMAVCDRRGANYFLYLIKTSLSLNKKRSIRSGILLTADGADADIAPTSKLCSSGLRSAGLPKQAARRTRAARRPVSWPAAASLGTLWSLATLCPRANDDPDVTAVFFSSSGGRTPNLISQRKRQGHARVAQKGERA
jgi:hypothetical protein